MPTRLTRSRAFWNLRAEQVMDQVFHPSDAALKAVKVAVLPQASTPRPKTDPIHPGATRRQGLFMGTAMLAVLGIGTSLWLAQNWQRTLQSLNRERDLQMIERLRGMPVAGEVATATTATTAVAPEAATPAAVEASPQEAPPRTASLEPLTIPLAASLPVPTATDALSDDAIAAAMVPAEPLLVGVVHAGGGQGSAIFQLDQLSLSAIPGEAIGNSGWRLKTVESNGAVIEHNGEERSLRVGGAF